jgi:hypothetical protein
MRKWLLIAAVAACCPIDAEATVRIDYPGCNTRSCERRMRARRTADRQRWRQVARPYRAWLASTRGASRGQPAPYDGPTPAMAFMARTSSRWVLAGGRRARLCRTTPNRRAGLQGGALRWLQGPAPGPLRLMAVRRRNLALMFHPLSMSTTDPAGQ